MPTTSLDDLHRELAVGGRQDRPVSGGRFRMPRDFLGDPRDHPRLAGNDRAARLQLGCLIDVALQITEPSRTAGEGGR